MLFATLKLLYISGLEMAPNLLSSNLLQTNFLLSGLLKQLSKVSNPIFHVSADTSLLLLPAARNPAYSVIFDSSTSVSDHI
jgi:hypothetical protein